MTAKNKLKRRVRHHMTKTGKSYTAALRWVKANDPEFRDFDEVRTPLPDELLLRKMLDAMPPRDRQILIRSFIEDPEGQVAIVRRSMDALGATPIGVDIDNLIETFVAVAPDYDNPSEYDPAYEAAVRATHPARAAVPLFGELPSFDVRTDMAMESAYLAGWLHVDGRTSFVAWEPGRVAKGGGDPANGLGDFEFRKDVAMFVISSIYLEADPDDNAAAFSGLTLCRQTVNRIDPIGAASVFLRAPQSIGHWDRREVVEPRLSFVLRGGTPGARYLPSVSPVRIHVWGRALFGEPGSVS
jgi:hypothetical protein